MDYKELSWSDNLTSAALNSISTILSRSPSRKLHRDRFSILLAMPDYFLGQQLPLFQSC
jgi:hypothetical protein